jgi:predicted O-methyltransferase YrrM
MAVDLAHYAQSRISPFDEQALRLLLAKASPDGGLITVMEIGSWFGAGSTQILAAHAEKVICVDHWKGSGVVEHDDIIRQIDPYSIFQRNIAAFREKVVALRCDSSQIAEEIEDNSIDFAFIDGDHRYAQTKQDIEVCLPKIRKGGVLCGHSCEGRVNAVNEGFLRDYREDGDIDSIFPKFKHCHPGVIVAVDETLSEFELFSDDKFRMESKSDDGVQFGYSSIWFTFKK